MVSFVIPAHDEARHVGEFFAKFGDRLPTELKRQREELVKRLGK